MTVAGGPALRIWPPRALVAGSLALTALAVAALIAVRVAVPGEPALGIVFGATAALLGAITLWLAYRRSQRRLVAPRWRTFRPR